MANVIRLKRASGSDPTASDLVSGEPAVRTDTGELFFKKDDGSIAKVAGAGGGPDFKYLALRNAANNGAASFPNADFTLVTSGTTSAITPTAANTLLVSLNGVIQKPNTGTSTPSSGFALSGSTIKFGANISTAPDFILYQESGGIGEPSDDTVSEVKLKVSNSPVNGYFLSAQSGNNGGLTWAAPVATSCTGNSATATALATARTINGVSFDGTANITVTAAAGTLSGNTLNSSVTASSLTSLGDLGGLTVDGDATFTGANYNVLWDKSDNALEFADNAKAVFGNGSDLKIYSDGTNGILEGGGSGGNAPLFLNANTIRLQTQTGGEKYIDCQENGAVEVYHNNSKKFETTSSGTVTTGVLAVNDATSADAGNRISVGTSQDIRIYHIAGNDSYFRNYTGDTYLQGNNSGTVVNNIKFENSNGATELYFNSNKKFETISSGVSTDGLMNFNGTGDKILIGDEGKIAFGGGGDLKIYHDGSHSYIYESGQGKLRLITNSFRLLEPDNSTAMIAADENGAVYLYHNGTLRLETTSTGATLTGLLATTSLAISSSGYISVPDNRKIFVGTNDDIQIYHDSSANKNIIETTAGGNLDIGSTHNADVQIKTNGTNRFNFGAGGFVPLANNSYDLGTSSLRWRNLYTNDLNLSNEGGSNDVDGTWGSYTIQEGAEDLFLVNKRNGKKYKFNLTEVS